jgi:uncharacterized membrane protein
VTSRDLIGQEGDESVHDNGLGRLLALSDGVFAIAMTLLALDLKLPDLGEHVTDAQLRHALGDQWHSYLSFLVSFYVVAGYWNTHRRALRRVTELRPGVVAHTLLVLLLTATIPFAASVLGEHGGEPSATALYAAFNLAANLALIALLADVDGGDVPAERMRLRADIVVFAICVPGAYLLDGQAPWLLLLLVVSGQFSRRRARS